MGGHNKQIKDIEHGRVQGMADLRRNPNQHSRILKAKMEALVDALGKNQSIHTLCLTGNKLDDATMHILCNRLAPTNGPSTLNHITTLDVSFCNLSDASMKTLANAVERSNLTTLNVSFNPESGAGVRHLANTLSSSPDCHLQHLIARYNQVTADDLSKLCGSTSTLRTIDCSHCTMAGDWSVLADGLKENQRLERVWLQSNDAIDPATRDLLTTAAKASSNEKLHSHDAIMFTEPALHTPQVQRHTSPMSAIPTAYAPGTHGYTGPGQPQAYRPGMMGTGSRQGYQAQSPYYGQQLHYPGTQPQYTHQAVHPQYPGTARHQSPHYPYHQQQQQQGYPHQQYASGTQQQGLIPPPRSMMPQSPQHSRPPVSPPRQRRLSAPAYNAPQVRGPPSVPGSSHYDYGSTMRRTPSPPPPLYGSPHAMYTTSGRRSATPPSVYHANALTEPNDFADTERYSHRTSPTHDSHDANNMVIRELQSQLDMVRSQRDQLLNQMSKVEKNVQKSVSKQVKDAISKWQSSVSSEQRRRDGEEIHRLERELAGLTEIKNKELTRLDPLQGEFNNLSAALGVLTSQQVSRNNSGIDAEINKLQSMQHKLRAEIGEKEDIISNLNVQLDQVKLQIDMLHERRRGSGSDSDSSSSRGSPNKRRKQHKKDRYAREAFNVPAAESPKWAPHMQPIRTSSPSLRPPSPSTSSFPTNRTFTTYRASTPTIRTTSPTYIVRTVLVPTGRSVSPATSVKPATTNRSSSPLVMPAGGTTAGGLPSPTSASTRHPSPPLLTSHHGGRAYQSSPVTHIQLGSHYGSIAGGSPRSTRSGGSGSSPERIHISPPHPVTMTATPPLFSEPSLAAGL
eukprot:TRINITY_DN57360_c0_g1_i1.p1 TRINITY_DN57360_c0_g1~~TRINITY_DN57360_c0_g1_i1.p1  ORF type:complete len:849 (-),score=69.11 TRINITY_DN57360_c0_g1_i1:647-3193(-)